MTVGSNLRALRTLSVFGLVNLLVSRCLTTEGSLGNPALEAHLATGAGPGVTNVACVPAT
jgi:hypothetical protein